MTKTRDRVWCVQRNVDGEWRWGARLDLFDAKDSPKLRGRVRVLRSHGLETRVVHVGAPTTEAK